MAIHLEHVSLLVRRSSVAERYPGGVEAFWADCPTVLVGDDHLLRFGAMTTRDIEVYAAELLARGPALGEAEVAIATRGASTQPWLAIDPERAIGWLAGTDPGPLRFAGDPQMLMAGDDAPGALEVAARLGTVRRLGSSGRALLSRGDAGIEIDLWGDAPIVTLLPCHERLADFASHSTLLDELVADLTHAGWKLPLRRHAGP